MKGHISPELLEAIFQGYSLAFNRGLRKTDTNWQKIAWLAPSSTSQSAYPFLGMTPKIREWVGERAVERLKLHGYTIKNKTFEQTIGVSRDVIEDDAYGVFAPLMEQMGIDVKLFPEEVVFGLLRDGDKTACFDGQNFFDEEHPINTKHDGTGTDVPFSNIITGSQADKAPWYLLDTTGALKPLIWQNRKDPVFGTVKGDTDGSVWIKNEIQYGVHFRGNGGYGMWHQAIMSKEELSGDALWKAYSQMRKAQGDGGKRLRIQPNTLVVPPEYEEEATKILTREFIDGSNNELKGKFELIVSDELAPDLTPTVP